MAWGKLAKKIIESMFGKPGSTRETLFALPNPFAHLFCH